MQLFGRVMRIVGLLGPKRSGKSTAADVLVRERGFVSIGFADALKDLALRVNPLVPDVDPDTLRGRGNDCALSDLVAAWGWEEAKRIPEVRRFLQELGTGVRDIVGIDAWTRAWARKVRSLPFDSCVVVPDVRFLNEAKLIRGWAVPTTLIRVTRTDLDSSDTHVSETEQAGIQCDREIVNGTSVDQLRSDVLFAHDRWLSTS